MPNEWATSTRVSAEISASMRLAEPVAQIRLGQHDRRHVDRAVERRLAGRLAQRRHGVAAQLGQHVGDARRGTAPAGGPRRCRDGAGRGRRRSRRRQSSASTLHAVVPQPVPHRRQPPGLELVGAPQLVEGPVDDDDARHGCSARQVRRVVVAADDPALGCDDDPRDGRRCRRSKKAKGVDPLAWARSSPMAAPWLKTTICPPGWVAAMRSTARRRRPPNTSRDSAPGITSQRCSAHTCSMTGSPSVAFWRRSPPSHSPRNISRRSASTTGVRPQRATRGAAVWAVRCRVLT